MMSGGGGILSGGIVSGGILPTFEETPPFTDNI